MSNNTKEDNMLVFDLKTVIPLQEARKLYGEKNGAAAIAQDPVTGEWKPIDVKPGPGDLIFKG